MVAYLASPLRATAVFIWNQQNGPAAEAATEQPTPCGITHLPNKTYFSSNLHTIFETPSSTHQTLLSRARGICDRDNAQSTILGNGSVHILSYCEFGTSLAGVGENAKSRRFCLRCLWYMWYSSGEHDYQCEHQLGDATCRGCQEVRRQRKPVP